MGDSSLEQNNYRAHHPDLQTMSQFLHHILMSFRIINARMTNVYMK